MVSNTWLPYATRPARSTLHVWRWIWARATGCGPARSASSPPPTAPASAALKSIDFSAAEAGAVGGGDEADRAGPQPVARAQIHRQTCNVERAGRVAYGNHVFETMQPAECLFERRNGRTLRQ